MTAAFQPPRTASARPGGSRFFASPPRAPRHRHARPAKRLAGRKTAPGIFFVPVPKTRPETVTQVTNPHQESATYVFVFVSGCAVAPNNAATGGPTTYTGSINYSYGAFVLSHGSFSGQISGNGQTYNISGNINGVGFQAGYFSGTTPVSFTVNSPQNIGSNGVFFTGAVGAGVGPLNLASVDGSVFVNGATGNLSANAPEASLLGLSTDTNPANPGETFELKVGIGVSIGVQGVTVTKVTPVPSNPGGPPGG